MCPNFCKTAPLSGGAAVIQWLNLHVRPRTKHKGAPQNPLLGVPADMQNNHLGRSLGDVL